MSSRCLLQLPNPSQRPVGRLLCFPHAGASGLNYAKLFKDWELPLQVIVIDYPGHGSRFDEPLCDRIEDLASEVAGAAQSFGDLPLLLFGHSMGAFVAFETCRTLCGQALVPAQLIVSAQRAPHVAPPSTSVRSMTDAGFLAELDRLDGMSPEVLANKELVEMIVPVLRADAEACERYRLKEVHALPVPLAIYLGSADAAFSEADVRPWGELTSATHRIRVLPGNHFYFDAHKSEFLMALTEDIKPLQGKLNRST